MAINDKYQALYLHIPFCRQRCNYCDFCTKAIAQDSPEIDTYIEELILAIRDSSRKGLLGDIKTIYVGGGTPSFLGLKRLVNLVYTLSLSVNLKPKTEFTIEANPESLTAAMVKDLFSLGVNRISIGVQSFLDNELSALGRIHSSAQAKQAIEICKTRLDNVSIDLMCGIPLQTIDSWRVSLEEAVQSGVQHISIYPLTLEDETPLAKSVESGEVLLAAEDEQAKMMELAANMLANAGYQRYEVASYAQVGFECQHNISYWTGKSYLGLGTGAASMQNLTPDCQAALSSQTSNSVAQRQRCLSGELIETLNPAEVAAEDLMLGMRMAQGVSVEQIKEAKELLPQVSSTFKALEALGLAELSVSKDKQQRYLPTTKGWLLGNELYSRIWDLAK